MATELSVLAPNTLQSTLMKDYYFIFLKYSYQIFVLKLRLCVVNCFRD